MTFQIFYRQTSPIFDGALNHMGTFNRRELRQAVQSLRWYAHGCRWKGVAWVLKRGNKTIATIIH